MTALLGNVDTGCVWQLGFVSLYISISWRPEVGRERERSSCRAAPTALKKKREKKELNYCRSNILMFVF